MCFFIQYIVCISSIAFLIHITLLYPGKGRAERIINSHSTITLSLPYSDGTARPSPRLPFYSEAVILIPDVFNRILPLHKVITLRNKYLKTISVLRLSTLFTGKKNRRRQRLTNTKLENKLEKSAIS